MTSPDDIARFQHLTYDDFRRMATDDRLSGYEKIGFPDSYRAGKEEPIFADLQGKLPALAEHGKVVIDIGPGCSGLPRMLIDLCAAKEHSLVLVDSSEMLDQLPDAEFITKVSGRFPEEAPLEEWLERADLVVAYSVLHYVFADGNIWSFFDRALSLLAEGGTLLLGDLPNVSKRKRFFSSLAGVAFHRSYTGADTGPEVDFNCLEPGLMDDAIIFGLLGRARAAGFDSYVVPQPDNLPMANRREDVLVRRP